MANLARVTITKPAGSLVSITRRLTDMSNTVAVTVNKNTQVVAQNESAAQTTTGTTWQPTSWRAGCWR